MEIIEPAQDIIESTSLILDGNKISSISNLEKFTHLEKVYYIVYHNLYKTTGA